MSSCNFCSFYVFFEGTVVMFDATATAAAGSAFYFITFYFLLLSRVSVIFIFFWKA
jgi:hypothetical protein